MGVMRGRFAFVSMMSLAFANGQTFEVASIKPHDGSGFAVPRQLGPEAFVARDTLKELVRLAYGINRVQLTGGPDWAAIQIYDVRAKAERSSTPDEIRAMLRALLEDRFALKFHRENRTVPVYVLSVDARGLKPQESGPDTARDGRGAIQIGADYVWGRGVTMKLFTEFLSGSSHRPVLDRTGLERAYEFKLNYNPDELSTVADPAAGASEPAGSVFTALESVGLRLTRAKAPVEFFVIDQAQRPSEN